MSTRSPAMRCPEGTAAAAARRVVGTVGHDRLRARQPARRRAAGLAGHVRLGLVLDLPDVVEDVPGRPAQEVARRPASASARRCAPRRSTCATSSRQRLHARRVAVRTAGAGRRSCGRSDRSRLDDVVDHLVAVAAAAARPLAQRSGRLDGQPVELRPARRGAAATCRSASAAVSGRRSAAATTDGAPKAVVASPSAAARRRSRSSPAATLNRTPASRATAA